MSSSRSIRVQGVIDIKAWTLPQKSGKADLWAKCPRWFWVHCFCCLSSWHTSDPKVIQFSCSTKWMDVGMLPTARLPRSFASIIWTLHFKWPVNGQALISNQNSRCAEWPVRFCKAVPAGICFGCVWTNLFGSVAWVTARGSWVTKPSGNRCLGGSVLARP